MKGEERRKQLLNILSSSNNPVSGGTLAKELNVSRQIIVQDISLLRANGATIFSTNKGYLLQEDRKYSRVFKVYHTDDQVEEELSTIVDAGGQIRDVFVYHKVYGVLKADMGIKSRRDIRAYMEEISTGKWQSATAMKSLRRFRRLTPYLERTAMTKSWMPFRKNFSRRGSLRNYRTTSPLISGAVRNKNEKSSRTRLSTRLILVLVIPKEFQSTLLYLEYLKI